MINRYSSRKNKLDTLFLNEKLNGALAYDRIAGYFSISIFEIASESIESMSGKVRIVCNSNLTSEDIITLTAAKNAMRKEWCNSKPEEKFTKQDSSKLIKIYELLISKKVEVKVIPNEVFGLIHGKAGVITLKNGKKTSFMGSVNETYSGWKLNYEILWEDDSTESIEWIQEEFNFFWNHHSAIFLSEFIVDDIQRISKRHVITSIEDWKKESNNSASASTVIESPVYRQEFGLWEHQKYFINLAFENHKKNHGARFVLADMVGLGKTIQLAASAQLMALYGEKPILIIAPKTLLWQWQDEMGTLLDMPSAVWDGKQWVDENGIKYPNIGSSSIKKCPRKIGIISQGLITADSEVVTHLLNLEYECIILDEAHRARRSKFTSSKMNTISDYNNLIQFLIKISVKTKSMLLATATPVQVNPIEAWDLLNILSQTNDSVMGDTQSKWRKNPELSLDIVMSKDEIKGGIYEKWAWIKNPFPEASENPRTFGKLRSHLELKDDEFVIKTTIDKMSSNERTKLEKILEDDFFIKYNPFIRHIVRRTRKYLEDTINPETNEPYLKKIKVNLCGEKESLNLPPYLMEAYSLAEKFSNLLNERKCSGFIITLLLKRTGSTMFAGKNTAEKMLEKIIQNIYDEEDDDVDYDMVLYEVNKFTEDEISCLQKFISILSNNAEKDPKYVLLLELLIDKDWISKGCIVFSQYYDSISWLSQKLSKDLPLHKIGLYAGGDKSGIFENGIFTKRSKEDIKNAVNQKELKLLMGTDAASEGLNLQTLGSLINIDLPWNPTRLEQRKGRIQRIGQLHDEIYIYNMQYKGSVEERVHSLLASRFENIYSMFGQVPDCLEDIWINMALNEKEKAEKIINTIPKHHPFELKYELNYHNKMENLNWEYCEKVLDKSEKKKFLMSGWS